MLMLHLLPFGGAFDELYGAVTAKPPTRFTVYQSLAAAIRSASINRLCYND